MSADLVPIDSEPPNTEDVVAKLEEFLAEARKGQISSVAIAVVYRDGSSGRAWSKRHSETAMIGSVGLLHHALSERYFEE
jgi:hypothetical protein